MSTNPNDSINYFIEVRGHGNMQYTHHGLTKREYFAAMAMSDLIGKKYGHVDGFNGNGICSDAVDCAQLSVMYADALIAELNKGEVK